MCECMYVRICMQICIYGYVFVSYLQVYMCECMYVRICMQICIYGCMSDLFCMHACARTGSTYSRILTQTSLIHQVDTTCMRACMHAYMLTCMHVYIHTCIPKHTYINT
jgi:hypothetical protein